MKMLGEWRLTSSRFAIHEPTQTAVVADLHLGYGRVRRRGGEAVPQRSLDGELVRLQGPLHQAKIHRLVIAGDLFEDGRYQRDEMVAELLNWQSRTGTEIVAIVPGNHDRGLSGTNLPISPGKYELGGWQIVHGDGILPDGAVVQGHEHPWMRWQPGVEGPCYLVGEQHLILPAWSTDAAGVNVLSQDCRRNYRCCVIAGDQVLDFGRVKELQERRRG